MNEDSVVLPQPETEMNLFLIDANPAHAATALYDLHVNKMILETAQILDGGTRPAMHDLQPGLDHDIVKIPTTHRDNPVIRSAGDPTVWDWAYSHFTSLLREFHRRHGHPHSYARPALLSAFNERRATVDGLMTRRGFYLAVPDRFLPESGKWTTDLALCVAVYRQAYAATKLFVGKQHRPAVWTKTVPPMWLSKIAREHAIRGPFTEDGLHYFFQRLQ